MPSSMPRLLHGLLLASGAAGALALPGSARASEGGGSFYLLGSGGPGAAEMPPLTGIFFDSTLYIYDGSTQAERQFVIGGNLVAGLDATIAADFATALWVPSTDFLGGTLAVGAALPIGNVDVNVDAVITGPGGGQVAISREDCAFVVGDPVGTVELGWNLGGNVHLATSAQVNVPIGNYREGELANLAFHRWIVDWSTALTWRRQAGWMCRRAASRSTAPTRPLTTTSAPVPYRGRGSSGSLSPVILRRLQAYHYQQVTGDSGAGARLGPYEGRVSGVGATAPPTISHSAIRRSRRDSGSSRSLAKRTGWAAAPPRCSALPSRST
jgi:hypothetical protein